MFRATIALAALAFSAMPAWAQNAAPDYTGVTITTTDLGHGTYMLQGQGGNITIAVGGNGIIMVDGQFAPLHDKIKAAIAAVSLQPIRYLINTHYHGDHTGGNAGFAADGVTVVAHQNVKKRLATGTVNGLTGMRTPPANDSALPDRTYASSLTLTVKGLKAVVGHIKHAHTDGDSYVYFPAANVLATGDIVTVGGRYPNIDVANGGNIKGMIAGVDTYLNLATDKTKIVPGHGPQLTRAQVAEYRKMLIAARDRVAKMLKANKGEDEVVAAKPLADIEKKIGANEAASANFVRLIYRSLKVKT